LSKENQSLSYLMGMDHDRSVPAVSMRARVSAADQIEGLYREGFHRYLRVADVISCDPGAGLDAVQEGFARALRHVSAFRGDAQLSTWVWKCVVNAAKAARARSYRAMVDETKEASAPTETSGLGESWRSELRGLIASLPERQRHVLFLRYYADLDYQAIADVLDLRIGTVGAALNKAHSALRRQLEEAHDDHER
jgi:RNA polymerase sigma-70 factor (ECF subfamily)